VRLGIFGGTFDPPHIGHRVLASGALERLKLDKVLWVLTFQPPHKQENTISSLKDRLDMVQAAIADNHQFEFSRIDIDRPPPHYAVDTIKLLGNIYPNAELVYLMGGDSLENLLSWNNPIEFVRGCHEIGVLRRPGDSINLEKLELYIPGIKQKIHFVDAGLMDVSASLLRDRIRGGRSYQDFVHPEVYKIIEARNLYQAA
jgi:nicotinate-nucleotide adenylyltransferase